MSILDKNIAIPKSIEDYCAARDKAIAQFKSAWLCIELADKALGEVYGYLIPYGAKPDLSVERFTKEVDARMWRHAFDKAGLRQYMDRKAVQEFENSLDKETPPFTIDNVRNNLVGAASQADTFFVRGMVEFFLSLSKSHKSNTNEPFKVNRKAIMQYAVENWFGRMTVRIGSYANGIDKFNDMDRVFKTLDGKKHKPRELECGINAAWKESNLYEDDYYKIRGFKNGNAHIEFKRADLLEKANKLISEYYNGQALAA